MLIVDFLFELKKKTNRDVARLTVLGAWKLKVRKMFGCCNKSTR